MSTFHKPKVFRSQVGCCICRAKSSSSRFTDSSKYEDQFQSCFKLEEERIGEICNACVLLVKRWKKLPKNTKRNWAHVVDARAGPGAKSFVKQKKKEEKVEEFEKIRRKHVYRKKSRSGDEESCSRPQTPMSHYLSPDFVGKMWCQLSRSVVNVFLPKVPRQLKELKKIRSQTFLILLIGNGN